MGKLALRWIYEACYEIVTPEGEHIVVDPDINVHKFPDFSADDFKRVDYLLCTHTHFDHTSDIGYLSEKFQPRTMIGELSAMNLARFFNLSFGNLYPVGNGDVLDFGSVKFQFYRAKHTKLFSPDRGRPESSLQTTIRNFGIEGHGECDQFGWLENYHILMTFSNNMRLMMAGGCADSQEIYRIGREFAPNILIRQTAFDTPKEFAEECAKFGAPIILPYHHEKVTKRWGMSEAEGEAVVNQTLDALVSDGAFCFPEQYQWYEIGSEIRKK